MNPKKPSQNVIDVVDAVETPSPQRAPAAPRAGLLGKAQDWWQTHGGSIQEAAQATKDGAVDAGERAKAYVQKEPVKAVAIAAAAGMVVSAVMSARARNQRTKSKPD